MKNLLGRNRVGRDRVKIGIPAFGSMEEVLDFLFQKSCQDKLVFVLDEYSYLKECVTGLDSILQSFIDKYSDSGKIKLILCGSFVDVMRSLLSNENPLYGRMDLTIDLKPMNYLESALFYPEFSDEDKVRLYSVSSGPAMVDVLDKLIRMELVEKQVPINDEMNRKK